MIKVKKGKIEIIGESNEIIDDLAIIKLGLIDTVGEKITDELYKESEKLVNEELNEEIGKKLKNNLPEKLAEELINILNKSY